MTTAMDGGEVEAAARAREGDAAGEAGRDGDDEGAKAMNATTTTTPTTGGDDDDGATANATAEDARAMPHNAATVTRPGEGKAPPRGAAVHMTERQLYAFRQQIAAYAHICQQLLQITTVSATQQTPRQREARYEVPGSAGAHAGANASAQAFAAMAASGTANAHQRKTYEEGQRVGRGEDKGVRGPRWSGTPDQYKILEDLFLAGEQPPVRARLTEITKRLQEHGPIQEHNVYNWFQNRRSREKKRLAEERASNDAALDNQPLASRYGVGER